MIFFDSLFSRDTAFKVVMLSSFCRLIAFLLISLPYGGFS